MKAVSVLVFRLDRLHTCLDGVKWHSCISANISLARFCLDSGIILHCDDTRHGTYSKCADGPEFLARRYIALRDMLQGRIAAKSDSRVCSLSKCRRNKALEEASDTLLLCNDPCARKETIHSWHSCLSVVDATPKLAFAHTAGVRVSYSCVFILSKGVTARTDSVMPVASPARTVAGPEILPSASFS